MKERLLVIIRVKEALKGIKADAINCLICDAEFKFKKNLYRHLKKPCKSVFTSVEPRLSETLNKPSSPTNILSDHVTPNPWDDNEDLSEPEPEPEPEKGTVYTPPELEYMLKLDYKNWKIGTPLPEEVTRLLFSQDPNKIQGIRRNLLSITENHVPSPVSKFPENHLQEFENLVNTKPPAENKFENYDALKESYNTTWIELRRLDGKGQKKSESTIKQYSDKLFNGPSSLYAYCADNNYNLADIIWPICRRSDLLCMWISLAKENPVLEGMRLNSLISFLKFVKHQGSMHYIPVDEPYLSARRELWKNEMELEIARVSNMVSESKTYIKNASTVNRTVKEGLNPTRYEDIMQIFRNYFLSDNYTNLTETVKTLKTQLESSKHPDRLITEVSIQLAVATVMFNGQRPEVSSFLSHDDLLSRKTHPTLQNHSVVIVNE